MYFGLSENVRGKAGKTVSVYNYPELLEPFKLGKYQLFYNT